MESQSIEELFEALKKTKTSPDSSSIDQSGEKKQDFDKDVLEFDEDSTIAKQQETFKEIEDKLRALPRMQTKFDALSNSTEAKEAPKVEDAVEILQMRKKDKTVKKPSVTEQWFTLPKPELTRELKRDLLLLKHRAALDPKRHYKKEKWTAPERFAVGTIVEDKTEFFSSRLTNKQRKETIMGTLMADDDTNKYFKRKYTEVQEKKTSGRKGHYRKVTEKRRRI
ncbi:LAFE_0B06260g1_1 [Lachancea fermentati]|uniref:LAFE_0B06260g1_1 n=1 Tax=Lachancea fermentati TaxID=4955 RepID=A0A1G4M7X9_LACFM|nr:LAFE_0B06260g1_1 [Lachancea fermentati]